MGSLDESLGGRGGLGEQRAGSYTDWGHRSEGERKGDNNESTLFPW